MHGPIALLLLSIASIAGLTTGASGAETFTLANGDRVTGEVVERGPTAVVIEHPVFGRIAVPFAEVQPESPPKPGVFGTRLLEGWSREVALGVNGSEGNTVDFNLRASLDLEFEDERRRWEIGGRYVFESDDNDTSENNANARLQRDWLFPGSRWFAFLGARYEYDRFENWKHRIAGVTGPGYAILDGETLDLRTRIGFSYQREFAGESDNIYGGFWGLELDWRINSRLHLKASNQVLPYFSEIGEYRNLSGLELTVHLTEAPALNLHVGVENEYDSNAVPEDDKNDLSYSTTIGWEF